MIKFLERVFALICIIVSYAFVYAQGVDAGYWEHEAEENAYGCDIIKAADSSS